MTNSEKTIADLQQAVYDAQFEAAIKEHSERLCSLIDGYGMLYNLTPEKITFLLCFKAGMLIGTAPKHTQKSLAEKYKEVIESTIARVAALDKED